MHTVLARPDTKVRVLSVKKCKRAVKATLKGLAEERPSRSRGARLRWLQAACAACRRCELSGRAMIKPPAR